MKITIIREGHRIGDSESWTVTVPAEVQKLIEALTVWLITNTRPGW